MNPTPPTILVVDDYDLNRRVLQRRLSRSGFRVVLASGGVEALEIVEEQGIDLVLLDVMMADMNGPQVLSVFRERHTDVELPVIMVTAVHQSDDVVAALQAGANDWVSKPIDFPVLLARMRTQLSRSAAVRALKESEARYALAVAGSNDGLWHWHIDDDEWFFSPRWKAMLGFQGDELPDRAASWFERVHAKDLKTLGEAWGAHLQGETLQLEAELRVRHRDDSYRWMLVRGLAVRDGLGTPVRIAGSMSDTTDAKVLDPLTGLPNRVLFVDRLGRAIARQKRRPEYLFAVLFLDLDRFKLVNDSFGHTTGDLLLIEMARRLKRCLRDSDTVSRPLLARLGGDEFTILVDDISGPEDVKHVADRVQAELSLPYRIEGLMVVMTASVGIAMNHPNYTQPEELLRDADTAMYRAKAGGGAQYEVFDTHMHKRAVQRLEIETDLRSAIRERQFELHYQPIVDILTGQISAFEALIRWRHPTRGLVSPGAFVPIAEETGLIHPMGTWVFEESCKRLRSWLDEDPTHQGLHISVNVSRKQLLNGDLASWFAEILQRTEVSPEHVHLELTESVVLEHSPVVLRVLDGLLDQGMKLTMDDFGTGFSSLSVLQSLPFSTLKIDRTFISGMDERDGRRGMVTTIVQLAANLGLDVIAEGVETEAQLAALRGIRCQYAQGFLLARPNTGAVGSELLQAGRLRTCA